MTSALIDSAEQPSKGRRWAEILVVLALSLGASAVYSIVSLANKLTQNTALNEQASKLNQSLSPRPEFDLIYQVLGIAFGLAPVALVVFLTWRTERPRLAGIGLPIDLSRPSSMPRPGGMYGKAPDKRWWLPDLGSGVLLALAVGIPGLVLYALSRQAGLNTTVEPSGLGDSWWAIPVLILAAGKAAVLEEVIVVGYLFNRLRLLGWREWNIILFSALLRGSYHLYQGFGGFIGNVAMGVFFGWVYHRWGRLLPLVIAHWMLDIVSFVGYAWALSVWPELLK